MRPIYEETFTVKAEDCDAFGRLKPSALLHYVQEVSGNHAQMLGAGWDQLQEKKLFWAIIRHRVSMTRLPAAGEVITLQTHPMPTSRVAYPRATTALDKKGNVLFRSHALWVLMDIESRAMILPGKSGVPVEGVLLGNELETPGSLSPKELSQCATRLVTAEDLDQNRHVNNARYLDWLEALLDEGFRKEHTMTEFSVCYLSEALLDQQIQLRWELSEEGILTADAHRQSTDVHGKNDRIFAARLHFSQCSVNQ